MIIMVDKSFCVMIFLGGWESVGVPILWYLCSLVFK